MHVMFFGYGRHDDCSEAIMIVGLAMAFSNGFAELSVLRVYHRKKAIGSGFFTGFSVDAFPAFLPSRNRQMTSLGWEVGLVGEPRNFRSIPRGVVYA